MRQFAQTPPIRLLVSLALIALLHGPILANQAPVVDELSATPATPAPGEVVTLTVRAHDPECPGTCTSECGQAVRADLTAWSVGAGSILSQDNGVAGSPYEATAQWQTPSAEGVYTVSVTLSDNGTFFCGGRKQGTTTFNVEVKTLSSQPPVVESLTATAQQLFPGESADLSCTATDPDGDPVTYSWHTDSGTLTPGPEGAAQFTAGAPGIATVTCTATDPSGAFGLDTIALRVRGAVADAAITANLITPLRMDVDAAGNVYVVDRAAGGIVVVDLLSGEFVYDLPLGTLSSLAVDWNGDLLIGDANGARLVDRAGTAVAGVTFDSPLRDVADVAVDPTNRRYGVLHKRAGRVNVYDEAGTLLLFFGTTGDGPDEFKSPQGLAATPGGQWVVADTGHGLIKVFDAAGSLLTSFGGLGGGPGEFVRLDDVAVDAAGVIYASDRFQDWIQAFNPDGSPREAFGGFGDELGQFETAAGVATADAFDRLLAASVNTSSIQVFRTSNAPVVPLGPGIPELDPTTLSFGEQALGTVSEPLDVTLSNSGASILGLHGIAVQGDFLHSDDCGPFVDPGQSCSLAVSFRPSAVGSRTGSLVLETNGYPARRATSLGGTAFLPLPKIELAPSLLTFGDQQVGTISAPLPVTLSNTGQAALEIAAIQATEHYLQTNDCPASFAAGTTCTVWVRFAPTIVAESVTGTLDVHSNAADSPHRVGLDGRSTPVVPLIAVGDQSLDEGDEGDLFEAEFAVTLSEPTTEIVTVDYATQPGSAESDVDFQSQSGTLIFLPGETTQTISVAVIGDGLLEPDEETFFVVLEAAAGGVIDDGTGIGTIFDDETCIGYNLPLNPGAEERVVSTGQPIPRTAVAGWTTVAGSWQRRAAPPEPVEGQYFFYPSTTAYAELAQDVDVSTFVPRIDTDRQWFSFEAWVRTLYESPTDTARVVVEYRDWENASILDSFDTGPFSSPGLWQRVADQRLAPIGTRWVRIRLISTYLGDAYFDSVSLRSLRVATVVVEDTERREGDTGFGEATFNIRMACPLPEEVRVDYSTVDQSARSGEDYLAEIGTLTLPVGATAASVAVSIVGDEVDEPHETLGLSLSLVQPTDALLLDDLGVCLIRNDDFCPQSPKYWQDNPRIWPVSRLILGGVEYGQLALLELLQYEGSDQSHLLARHLIATKLNLEKGSDPWVQTMVYEADDLLSRFPPGSQPSGHDKREAARLTEMLSDYNQPSCR